MSLIINQIPTGINFTVDANPVVLVCSYSNLSYNTDNKTITINSPTLNLTYKESDGITINGNSMSGVPVTNVVELLKNMFSTIKFGSEIAATYASINSANLTPRNIFVAADETNAGKQTLYIHNGTAVAAIASGSAGTGSVTIDPIPTTGSPNVAQSGGTADLITSKSFINAIIFS